MRFLSPMVLVSLLLIVVAVPAHAYIGPGLGAGTIGVVLGLAGSVLLAVVAVFWYPLKRTFRRWVSPEDIETLEIAPHADEVCSEIAASESDEPIVGRPESSS